MRSFVKTRYTKARIMKSGSVVKGFHPICTPEGYFKQFMSTYIAPKKTGSPLPPVPQYLSRLAPLAQPADSIKDGNVSDYAWKISKGNDFLRKLIFIKRIDERRVHI